MDSWDPRRDDFDDKKFNSYDRGPGRNIRKNQDKREGVQLYITGIPKELSDDGLSNLFSRAGNVLHAKMMVSKRTDLKSTFGFVTMSNLAEAEDAIRQLNKFELREHTLKVAIAMSDEDRQRRRNEKQDQEEFLNSLPSSRMGGQSRSKGSDSDSDKGSVKSGRRIVLTNGQLGGHKQMNNQGIRNDGRQGLLGSYLETHIKCGGRVTPNPSYMPVQHGPSQLSQRFNQFDGNGLMEYDGQSDCGSYAGARGRGRGASPHNFRNKNSSGYGRGMPQGDRGYGYGGNPGYGNPFGDGYGRGSRQPRYYNDGNYMDYRGFGRGQPYQGGDYNNGYEGYGGGYHEDHSYNNNNYGYTYEDSYHHNTPNYGVHRKGNMDYGKRQNMHSSMESLAGPRKDVKRAIKVDPRPCNVCSTTGVFQCSRCKTPYCSAECQKSDWERHKQFCQDLRKQNEFATKFENQFEIDVGEEIVEQMKTKVEQSTGGKVDYKTRTDSQKSTIKQHGEKSPKSSDGEKQTMSTSPQKQQSKISSRTEEPRSPVLNKSSPKNSPSKSEAPKQDIDYCTLPLNSEIEVLLADNTSPDHFAVQLQDAEILTAADQLLNKMNNFYNTGGEIVQSPNIGMVYAAQFSADNNWYRARVDAINGDSVAVTYIDYGNTENLLAEKLRLLSFDMTSMKSAAIICQLDGLQAVGGSWSREAIDKFKTLVIPVIVSGVLTKVIASSVHNRIHKVKVMDHNGVDVGQTLVNDGFATKGGAMDLSQTKSELRSPIMSSELKKVADSLHVGSKENVLVTEKNSPVLFYGQIVQEEIISRFSTFDQALVMEMDSLREIVQYRPKSIGEIVYAKFTDGKWYRAEILSVSGNDASCLFLDYGNKATVNFSLIQQASPLCKSVPQIAVKMKIEGVSEPQTWTKNTLDVFDDLINMDQPKLFEMEIKSVKSDIVEVDFLDEKGKSASALICQTMAGQSPSSVIMTSSIPKETLSVDGAKEDMMITELSIPSNRIYLQKAIQENAERIEAIRMEMTMFCKSNSNSYQPVKGELVCALFPDDGLWYRGDVLEVPGDNYRVQFVDYGNEAVVHPDGICKILPSFVELPRQAVCCTLKGYVLSDLKENQLITLSNTAMNAIITVEAHDIQNDAYVSTFYPKGDGTSINNMLREEEVHAAEESHEIIMASSVPMEPVPVDGSKIEVLITESLDMKHVYIQIYQEKYHQILQFLTQKLQSYCESNNEPYMPSKGELVCAKFDADGIWYRAEVLDISGDDYTVHFVDYGNKSFVKSSSIRKINCSLSSMSKQSICCNIVGVNLKSLSEDKLMQFATMAMQGKPVKLQGLEKKDGYYDVKLYTISDENINAMFGSVVEEVQQSAETTPQLRNATAEVIMATSLPQFELPLDGTKIRMKLSDIGDYENIYFQSDLQGDQHTLSQLSSQIGSFCQDNPLPHKPVKGELVCALFSEDSTWYRAEVLNISGEDYEHRFVDYGNCETTKCSNIRKIDETLTVIPKFGVCCNLKGVDLKSLPEEMILECLTLLTSDTVQVQAVQKNEQSYDIVVYTSNGENINQKFMLMPSNQEPVPEMYMASELPMKTLPLDSSTVNMVIMDATSLDTIYLQYCTVEDQETIIDLHRAINVYCQEKASPYKPIKGELVFAKFDSGDSIDWYRAEVLEIIGDTFKVRYVDYGNTSEVRCDQISKINKTLATPPSQTICCRLHQVDLKVFSPEKLLPLINLVRENKPVKVQAVILKERCYDVLLFTSEGMNVNEQLLVQDTPQPIQSIILTSSLSKTVLPANVEMNAVITEVMDDCLFYLQANIEETKISLDKILEQSHQYCSTNNTQYKPVKGELVCAQFSSDKVWYRANVEDINDGKYLVHYLDFGNQELTTEQSIRKIDPSLAVDPGHCVKCCLHDVPKSEEVKNTLNSLMGVIVNIKVIKEESNLYHMIIINNGINVNQQLKGSSKTPGAGRPKVSEQLQKSTSPKGKSDEASQAQQSLPSSGGSNYLSLKDISKTEPSAKNRFLITYVVDPTEFYCQIADPNEIQKLATLMQGMMCRCEIEDPDPRFRPQVGDLVCAFYPSDGNWYRGNVVEAYQNNTYLIHYLDFGNSELLEAKQIRSMLPEYIEMPLLAFKCSLPDLVPVGPIWDTAAKEKLKIFQAVSLDAEIVRREGETYIVNLAHSEEESKQIIDVSEQLINDGHAKQKSGNNADEADFIQQQIAALQAQLASMGKK